MRKCIYCNCDMIENCFIDDIGRATSRTVFVPDGGQFLGLPIPSGNNYRIKVEVCPQCGKIEFFANMKKE